MREHAAAIVVLAVALFFCGWNLFTGLREGKSWTWVGVWPQDADRHTSRWNYRAMLLLWALGAALSLFGLSVILAKGLS